MAADNAHLGDPCVHFVAASFCSAAVDDKQHAHAARIADCNATDEHIFEALAVNYARRWSASSSRRRMSSLRCRTSLVVPCIGCARDR